MKNSVLRKIIGWALVIATVASAIAASNAFDSDPQTGTLLSFVAIAFLVGAVLFATAVAKPASPTSTSQEVSTPPEAVDEPANQAGPQKKLGAGCGCLLVAGIAGLFGVAAIGGPYNSDAAGIGGLFIAGIFIVIMVIFLVGAAGAKVVNKLESDERPAEEHKPEE